MHDPLRGSCGTARVQDKEAVLRVHHFGFAFRFNPLHDLVEVQFFLGIELDERLRPPEHEDTLDAGGIYHGLIHDRFEPDPLSPAHSDVCRDDQFRIRVPDADIERIRTKSCIDDAVHRTDAGTCEHGDDHFGDKRHVDTDRVAFPDPHLLEGSGKTHDLAEELPVRVDPLFPLLAAPYQGEFIAKAILYMAVEAVAGDVEGCIGEPAGIGIIPFTDGIPGREPFKLTCDLPPEAVRITEELLVCGVIILHPGLLLHRRVR